MQTYRLVFDAAAFAPNSWGVMLVPLVMSAVGLVLVFFSRGYKSGTVSRWPPHPLFAWFYFLLSAFVGIIFAGKMVGGWLEARDVIARKAYHVVSGPVTDFKPMPKEGHVDEQLTVGGVHFSYSDFVVNAGFHNTEAYGGPMHAGRGVRLSYICKPSEADCSDPLIVRVEVLVHAPAPSEKTEASS